MTQSRSPQNRVVIVGGGTAGWMTAASLAHRLKGLDVAITLVESSAIGTVGVGEATVPAIRSYFESLGLDTHDVMRACNATFKLGIAFADWRAPGHSFFHSFGRYGVSTGGVGFHHLWQVLHEGGDPHALEDYCLAARIAHDNRFVPAAARPRADFEAYDWAIHFDAGLFARYLRQFAEGLGVVRIDAKIDAVKLDGDSGDIDRLLLDTGDVLGGGLFIDCSGFRSLLMQGALKAGFVDWSQWLVCDRAVAIPCRHGDPDGLTPYTRATARKAGWTWRIPLQHRIGNGYVYASAHIDDADAEDLLRQQLDGEAIAAPNFVRFTPGHARTFWQRNCVAIGLAAGFLEPLESTSITLIQMAIDKLILMWPDAVADPRLAAEYNRISTLEFERIRDFIILHYALNKRTGEPLWDYCRHMPLPDTLSHRIAVYKARGQFVRYDWESFFDPSWLCMYDGFGIVPDSNTPFAARFPVEELSHVTRQIRADISALAAQAPSHADYIRAHCAAADLD